MKTLIVYAHPQTSGHCSAILEHIEDWHVQQQKPYEIIDLYKLKYDPVLKKEEHYIAGNKTISAQNKTFQEKIKKTKKIIFIYPIWWGSMPAILKGFFDRVFTPHFSFKYVYNKLLKMGIPKKLLKGKKAAVFMTTGSNKYIFNLYLFRRPAQIMQKDTLRFAGIKSKVFHLGAAYSYNDQQQKKVEKLVPQGLRWLYH